MTSTQTPLHMFLRPLLENIIEKGVAAGYARDAVQAVLIDLADETNLEDVEAR